MMSLKVPAVVAASVLLLALSGATHAQTQTTKKIVLKNVAPTSGVGADGKEVVVGVGERAAIPFQGEATLDENGNVLIDCTSASECPNIGAGTAAVQAPTLAFGTLADPIPDPSSGAVLTWTSNGDACYGKQVLKDGVAYTATGWEKSWPANTTPTVGSTMGYALSTLPRSPTAVTEYKFTLECHSTPTNTGTGTSAIAIRQGTATVRLAKVSAAADSCATYLAGLPQVERDKYHAYLPENRGFQRLAQTLKVYSGKDLGVDVGGIVGGAPGELADKQYLALSFSLSAGKKATIEMKEDGFGNPPFSPLVLSISPCPGDFRPRDYSSSDPFVSTAVCRTLEPANAFYSYLRTVSEPFQCNITAGQTYYFNISRQNTMLSPGSDPQNPLPIPPVSCAPSPGNRCGLSLGFSNQ